MVALSPGVRGRYGMDRGGRTGIRDSGQTHVGRGGLWQVGAGEAPAGAGRGSRAPVLPGAVSTTGPLAPSDALIVGLINADVATWDEHA